MTIISNHFNLIYFTNCNLEKPLISESKIVIPVRELGLLPGHPLNSKGDMIFLEKSYLIFDEVKKSIRELTGYVEYPLGSHHFKPVESTPKIIIDDNFIVVNKPGNIFGLEGVLEDTLEWVDWEIESASFYLMKHPSDNWDFTELWIDETAFPLKVLILVTQPEGISLIYDPSCNYQILFLSFTYQEAKLWLENNQYKPVEQRFKKEIIYI